jgi:hypothetical protein
MVPHKGLAVCVTCSKRTCKLIWSMRKPSQQLFTRALRGKNCYKISDALEAARLVHQTCQIQSVGRARPHCRSRPLTVCPHLSIAQLDRTERLAQLIQVFCCLASGSGQE